VREQLIQLGLHVVEADNADEALHLIDNLPNLDGMVSDIMLSGSLDGRQLAYRLHHKHPRSIILLISGYSHDASPEAANGVTFPLLRKPFDQQSLSHVLWQASQQEEQQP
jgi:DNA-binding NtrC family response regulator